MSWRSRRSASSDWLAVTLAGASAPAARVALAVALQDEPGDHGATIVGTDSRLTPPAAAIVNGTASHALDYDDANAAMIGHPSVPVLGALLPLAGRRYMAHGEGKVMAGPAASLCACGDRALVGS